MTRVTHSAAQILIVNLARFFGGAEARVVQLASAFGPQMCQVAVLQGSPLAKHMRAIGQQPVEIAAGKTNLFISRRLAEWLREGFFTLVDAHNVQSYFWTVLALRNVDPRPALVATIHSSTGIEYAGTMKGRFYRRIERWAEPQFDQVVTVSEYLREAMVKDGVPAGQIMAVPNATEMKPASREEGLRVRQELGIRPDQRVIGALGRLEPAKGYDLLIQAVAGLSHEHANLCCLIAGSGRMEPSLRRQAAELGVEDRLIFAGFRKDVPQLLAAMDIFALPSRTEGIPIALLEACTSRLPVVAARVGGVPEVIHNAENGLLVQPDDPGALAEALDTLLQDQALANSLAEQAAADIPIRFSVDEMIYGTRLAYAAALENRKGERL